MIRFGQIFGAILPSHEPAETRMFSVVVDDLTMIDSMLFICGGEQLQLFLPGCCIIYQKLGISAASAGFSTEFFALIDKSAHGVTLLARKRNWCLFRNFDARVVLDKFGNPGCECCFFVFHCCSVGGACDGKREQEECSFCHEKLSLFKVKVDRGERLA